MNTTPLRILLVEDNKGDAVLTQLALEAANIYCKLHVVGSVKQGLDFIFKRKQYEDIYTPDIIITDLNLPDFPGTRMIKEVKQTKQLRDIPIVVMTTSDMESDRLKCMELKANDYIVKDMDFDNFVNNVQTITHHLPLAL